MESTLQTDYLIVGAGAAGMAFADEVVHQNESAEIVIVDRRATPGGHWNDAYSFVTLHQPALYYGVNSLVLGSGGDDLASGAEIVSYYGRVMEALQASGRVTFLFRCEHHGDGRVISLDDPEQSYEIEVRDKVVDATYMNITVPATTPPAYEVDEAVNLVPVNGLARLKRDWANYTVIGAGKTGIDAVLHLLSIGTDPARIRWVVSNDSWMMNRADIRAQNFGRRFPALLRCVAQGSDVDDIYRRLEADEHVLRLDPEIWPTRNRCATVSLDELRALRRLPHIVRKGRVARLAADRIFLDLGEEAVVADTLFIDCTADGLTRRPARPIFEAERITLQAVVLCQPTLSAAAIGMFECCVQGEQEKNELCQAVPHPIMPEDYLVGTALTVSALQHWGSGYFRWFYESRLSVGHHMGFWRNLAFGFRLEMCRRRVVANVARLAPQTA